MCNLTPTHSEGEGVNPQGVFVRHIKDKNKSDMKWLTIDWIKQHSRIDFDCEDELLEMYGESAEETVLNVLGRSYTDLFEVYGRVPLPVVHASLMLVDLSYQNRSPISSQNMYQVPYTFDLLLKPYMRLADKKSNNVNDNRYGCPNL